MTTTARDMMRYLLLWLINLLCLWDVSAQGRWGLSISSGVQNATLAFRDERPFELPAPITVTAGRVFMLRNPDIGLWFYLRAESTRKTGAWGFGYRVYSRHNFGAAGSTKLFADLFLGLSPYAYSFPYVGTQRASGTFFSVGVAQFLGRNQSIEGSVGVYRTISERGRGTALQPTIGYSVFFGGSPRSLRSPKPKRFKNPTRCPESFD